MLVCGLCANADVCFRLLHAFRSCFQDGSLPTTRDGLPPLTTISRISRSGRRNITRKMLSRNFGLMPCFLYYKNRTKLSGYKPYSMICNQPISTIRSLRLLSHRGRFRAAIALKYEEETLMSGGLSYSQI